MQTSVKEKLRVQLSVKKQLRWLISAIKMDTLEEISLKTEQMSAETKDKITLIYWMTIIMTINGPNKWKDKFLPYNN